MSSEREYETAAHGASGSGQEPDVRPTVYIPQPARAPEYEQYTDPAAAHGWQNAYDETRELPPVVDPGEAEPRPAADLGEGRAERRRRQRRRGGRRFAVVVGAGALGVAGTVALIAGMAGSGSPAESRPTEDGRAGATASTRTDTSSPAVGDPATATGSAAPSTSGPAASPSAAASQGAATAGATRSPAAATSAPAATTTSGPAPTPTASTPTAATPTASPGRGHGHGWTRHPR
jgi:hypothetical protein